MCQSDILLYLEYVIGLFYGLTKGYHPSFPYIQDSCYEFERNLHVDISEYSVKAKFKN